MTIWFTSDNHFGHINVLRYCGRPFWSSEQCDEEMIKRWNEVVKPGDTVYHLGDVALSINHVKRVLPRLNGNKVLVVGNHDLVHPIHKNKKGKKSIESMTKEYLDAGFSRILPSGDIHIFAVKEGFRQFRLSHFPTKNCYDPYHNDKHDKWKPEDTGILNLCGHVHQSWLIKGNNVNVGVDVWNFRPVSMEQLLELYHEDTPTPHRLRMAIWKLIHTVKKKILDVFKVT
jgi:calcineurin-like phosphoesterase family protein